MIEAARNILETGYSDAAITRAYYAAFHALTGALSAIDEEARTHSGIHTLFARYYVKSGRLDRKYSDIFVELREAREDADYSVEAQYTRARAEQLIVGAEEIVERIGELLR